MLDVTASSRPSGHPEDIPPWQCRDSKIEHTTPWFAVRHDTVVRPDGCGDTYMHVVSPGSVTVLAMNDRGSVMLTRQWIYTHGSTQWRLPGGGIDQEDRDSLAAAHRELAEETGLVAADWTLLGQVHEADSLSNHVDTVFFATGLTCTPQRLRPGEGDLEIYWKPFDRLLDLVLAGELRHAGSAYAVLQIAVRTTGADRMNGAAVAGKIRPVPAGGQTAKAGPSVVTL